MSEIFPLVDIADKAQLFLPLSVVSERIITADSMVQQRVAVTQDRKQCQVDE